MIRYLSVCSGIEAFSKAVEGLPYSAVGFSEIDAFPCAVLAARYPFVPNLGDMTKINGWALRGAGAEIKETKACLGAHVFIYPSARVRVYEMTRPTLDMLGYDAPAEEEA